MVHIGSAVSRAAANALPHSVGKALTPNVLTIPRAGSTAERHNALLCVKFKSPTVGSRIG